MLPITGAGLALVSAESQRNDRKFPKRRVTGSALFLALVKHPDLGRWRAVHRQEPIEDLAFLDGNLAAGFEHGSPTARAIGQRNGVEVDFRFKGTSATYAIPKCRDDVEHS